MDTQSPWRVRTRRYLPWMYATIAVLCVPLGIDEARQHDWVMTVVSAGLIGVSVLQVVLLRREGRRRATDAAHR